MRSHLSSLALHTLDGEQRRLGWRLADGWTGTVAKLLDTIADLSSPR